MRNPIRRWLLAAVLSIAGTVGLAVPVGAQDSGKESPFYEPGISYKSESDYKTKMYIDGLCGFLIVAGCLAIAAKNPHRSHMD